MSRIVRTIVIIGAGFGGLRAALLLSRKGQRVILIDQYEYHTYNSMLYEIAVTPKEMANYLNLKSLITFPLADIAHRHGFTFTHGRVEAIDMTERVIRFIDHTVSFEYLIIATGAEPNYYDIPGLREHAIPFKTFMDALKIRDSITSLPLGSKPRVVIGGGGPTGIELAGEIQLTGLANVTVIQRPPSILPNMSTRVVAKATARLDILGVAIVYQTIRRVDAQHAIFETGESIPYDVLIWAGGTKPSTNLSISDIDRLNIYTIGDAAGGGLAVVALDQARIAVKNILGKRTEYQPRTFPYIMPIGGKYAIFQWGAIVFDGSGAWLLKCLVELHYLISIIGWWHAFRVWFKSMQIYMENDLVG